MLTISSLNGLISFDMLKKVIQYFQADFPWKVKILKWPNVLRYAEKVIQYFEADFPWKESQPQNPENFHPCILLGPTGL